MTINVPMEVSRFQVHRITPYSVTEDFVEVWGHVGDYEVMVCLSIGSAVRDGLISMAYAVREGLMKDGYS